MTKTRQAQLTTLYAGLPQEHLQASLKVALAIGSKMAMEHAAVIEAMLDQSYETA